MADTFVFSISADIIAQKLNVARLTDDLRASAVTVALAGVTHVGDEDSFTVAFKADLDVPNVAILNTVVQDTSGEPLPGNAVRADGVALVQIEPASESASLRAKGMAGEAFPAVVDGDPIKTSFTWSPSEAIAFQGISSVDVRDGDRRDYMDLLVVFPLAGTQAEWEAIPALGPWPFGPAPTPAAAGLTVPVTLIKFGEDIYVTQSGRVDGEIAEGVSTIAPPMQLVVDYYAHAVGVSPWVAPRIRYWVG